MYNYVYRIIAMCHSENISLYHGSIVSSIVSSIVIFDA